MLGGGGDSREGAPPSPALVVVLRHPQANARSIQCALYFCSSHARDATCHKVASSPALVHGESATRARPPPVRLAAAALLPPAACHLPPAAIGWLIVHACRPEVRRSTHKDSGHDVRVSVHHRCGWPHTAAVPAIAGQRLLLHAPLSEEIHCEATLPSKATPRSPPFRAREILGRWSSDV